jgi:uncharacterized protein (DUF427 family)
MSETSPDHKVEYEVSPKRVHVRVGDAVVADSTRVLLVRETGYPPVYYFPREDVHMELLQPSEQRTTCPYKGEASYFGVQGGDGVRENAAWSYESPDPSVAGLAGYIAFEWGKMDHWYEEDEEVFVHPRDPYVRIDVLQSSRPVTIDLGGETIAETHRAVFLFETGLPTRYYIPREDVRMEVLIASATRTACPYKGEAEYWSAHVGGKVFEDVAWSYPHPYPEVGRIKGLIAFHTEKMEAVVLDGELVHEG